MHEFVKYSLVGSINAGLDYSIYIGLTRFFIFWQENFLAANLLALFVANLSSFFLNKYFTFQNHSKKFFRQYLKFILVSLVYIGIVQAIMYLGVNVMGYYDLWVKVIASAIGLIWNFSANKFWSFRAEQPEV